MANKYNCGNITPSSCVPFTGKDLPFLDTEHQISCDASMDDVIDKIGQAIDALQEVTNIDELNSDCLTLPSNANLVDVTQTLITKVCALQAILTALQTQFNTLNIGSEQVTINMQCLASAAAPCQISTNTYTLIAVLNTLVTEVCAIKTHLGI